MYRPIMIKNFVQHLQIMIDFWVTHYRCNKCTWQDINGFPQRAQKDYSFLIPDSKEGDLTECILGHTPKGYHDVVTVVTGLTGEQPQNEVFCPEKMLYNIRILK